MKLSQLYEEDEYKWLLEHIKRIRQNKPLDKENLSIFLEDFGKNEVREVRSRLRTLLSHLLKYTYQYNRKSRSWIKTIDEERYQLQQIFDSSKTLESKAIQLLGKIYQDARKRATRETGLPLATFPNKIPLSFNEIMQEDRICL